MKNDYSKIENLIFDLDNTIILDKDEDIETYKEALENLGYNSEDYYKIYSAIDETEELLTEDDVYFTKEKTLNYINKKLNRNYTIELLDELSNSVGKYWIKNILLDQKIVEYLYKKYNLYVYTNFFEKGQYERLQNIGYDKP